MADVPKDRLIAVDEAARQAIMDLQARGFPVEVDPEQLATLAARESTAGAQAPGNLFQISKSNRLSALKKYGRELGLRWTTDPVDQAKVAALVFSGLRSDLQRMGGDVETPEDVMMLWSLGPSAYMQAKQTGEIGDRYLAGHPDVAKKLSREIKVPDAFSDIYAGYAGQVATKTKKPGVTDELGVELAAPMPNPEPEPEPKSINPKDELMANLDALYAPEEPVEVKISNPEEKELRYSTVRTSVGAGIGMLLGLVGGQVGAAARLARAAVGGLLGAAGSLGAQFAGKELQSAGVRTDIAEVTSYALEPLAIATTLRGLGRASGISKILGEEKLTQERFHKLDKFLDTMQELERIEIPVDKSDPIARAVAAGRKKITAAEYLMAAPDTAAYLASELGIKTEAVSLGRLDKMKLKAAPYLFSSDGVLRSIGKKTPAAGAIADMMAFKKNVQNEMLTTYVPELLEINKAMAKFEPAQRTAVWHLLDTVVDIEGKLNWRRLEKIETVLKKLEKTAEKLSPQKAKRLETPLTWYRTKLDLLKNLDPNGPEVTIAQRLRQYDNALKDRLLNDRVFVVDGGKVHYFEPRDYHVPYVVKPEIELSEQEVNRLVTELADSKGISKVAARELVEDTIGLSQKPTYFKFAKRRTTKMLRPDSYLNDPIEAYAAYTKAMSDVVSTFKAFGANYSKLDNLIKIAKATGDKDLAAYLDVLGRDIKGLAGRADVTKATNRFLTNLRATMTALKLPFAVIPNATQSHLTMAESGIKNFVVTLYRRVKQSPEVTENMQRLSPVLRSQVDQILTEALIGPGRGYPQRVARGVLKWTGFSFVEAKVNRAWANAVGWTELESIFKRLKAGTALPSEVRKLRQAGIDLRKFIAEGPTQADALKFGALNEAKTQFGSSVTDIPIWWRTPWGKTVTQFKNFAFNHAKFVKNLLKDAVLDYYATGDIRAFDGLLRLAYLMPTFGYVVLRLRDYIFDRQPSRDVLETVLDSFAAAGGLGIISDVITSASYGTASLAKTILGPGLGSVADIGEITSAKTPTKGLRRVVRRSGPIGKLATTYLWKPERRISFDSKFGF